MKDQKLIAVKSLMGHEGFRESIYECTAQKMTIGYGFNLETEKMPVDVAMLWLEILVKEINKNLESKLSCYNDLTENRKAVLINMAYNLGLQGLFNFKNTLDFIDKGKYKEASVEMLVSSKDRTKPSPWLEDVGYRAVELSDIMEKG